MRRIKLLAALGLAASAIFIGGAAWAQEEVRLSAIEMVESKNTIDHITQTDIERKTATNLWEAMKGTLGVYQQTTAGRNEGTISIRGSNRYQVGMFIDDIPVASSWRNEWDANNAMLYDLESIEVSKGYSSPLLASNNSLAGVVNLRTAKPTKEIEFSAKYLNFLDREFDDSGRLFAASLGAKRELFYLKTTVTQRQQDFFTLPSSFTKSPQEDGGRRENSDSKNKALNLIAGWTPTEDVDIMLGFVRQSMEKGQPVDAAQTASYRAEGATSDTTYPFNRYWRWPEYETTRYYLNGSVNLTEQAHLKAVIYNDEHKDTTYNYNMTTGARVYNSGTYDQYTRGGQLTFDYAFNEANKLAVSAGYRQLSHKEYSERGWPISGTGSNLTYLGKSLNTDAKEDYYDFGSEYTLKAIDPLTLVFGASYTRLTPKTLERYNPNDRTTQNYWQNGDMVPFFEENPGSKGLFNYQVGAFYELTKNHEIFATFAEKSRFGTMRERYSRYPDNYADSNLAGMPVNPDLKPEKAYNYEVGYRGLIADWLKVNSSLYYKEVSDLIVVNSYRYTARPGFGSSGFNENSYQEASNLDEATFYGFELGTEALFNKYLSAGLTFNYLEWDTTTKNPTQANLTQLPDFTGTLYAVVSPLDGLSIIPQVNYSSGFYWSSDPGNSTPYKESPSFTTADLKVLYDFNEHLSFELGAKNIFDKEYAYSAYYPEPGRNFFVGMTARY
jgi:iron complex outermembrane receptor protein